MSKHGARCRVRGSSRRARARARRDPALSCAARMLDSGSTPPPAYRPSRSQPVTVEGRVARLQASASCHVTSAPDGQISLNDDPDPLQPQPARARVSSQRRRHGRAGSGPARAGRDHQPGRWPGRARKARGARQAAAARAGAQSAGRRLAVPRAVAARGLGHVRQPGPGRRHHHRHRPGQRARVHDRGERRHREGRHLLSRSRSRSTCGPRRSPSRTACPASTWSIPAGPTCPTRTMCSPTASTSGASSSTRPTCRRWASRRSPW